MRLLILLALVSMLTVSLEAQQILSEVRLLRQYLAPSLSQAVVDDVADTLLMAEWLPQKGLAVDSADLLLSVLAAYTAKTPAQARYLVQHPEKLRHRYKSNAYLAPLLFGAGGQALFRQPPDTEAALAGVNHFRSGPREALIRPFAGQDLFNTTLDRSLPAIQARFRQPALSNEKVLTLTAEQALNTPLTSTPALPAIVLSELNNFILQRAQEEFAMIFLDRMVSRLHATQLQYLFPASSRFLAGLDVTRYETFLLDARQAFHRDLQLLGLNTSNYLRETGHLHGDQGALLYNLLLVYRMVELNRRSVPLTELLPYAHQELQDRRLDTERLLNLEVAGHAEQPSYHLLVQHTRQALSDIERAYDDLRQEEARMQSDFALHFADIFMKDEAAAQSLNTLRQQLNDFYYDALFRDNDNHYATEIPQLLEGQLDYAQLSSPPSLNAFETVFRQAPAPDTLRSLGLSMLRRIAPPPGQEAPVIVQMYDYLQDLRAFGDLLSSTIAGLQPDQLERQLAELESKRGQLHDLTEKELIYYTQQVPAAGSHQIESLRYLQKLTSSYAFADTVGQRPSEQLSRRQAFFRQASRTVKDHVWYLDSLYRQDGHSPAMQYYQTAAPEDPLQVRIDSAAFKLAMVSRQLDRLDQQHGDAYRVSYKDAGIFQQITQTAAQVLYVLYDEQSPTGFLAPQQLQSILQAPYERQIFLGLLSERIRQTGTLGQPAPEGLAHIATLTAQAIQDLHKRVATLPDTLRGSGLSPKLRFVSSLLNAIIETPLFQQGAAGLQPLGKLYPRLADVPEAGRQLTELIEDSEQGNYRYALENLVNLLDLFYPADSSRRLKKLESRIADESLRLASLDAQLRGHQDVEHQATVREHIRDAQQRLQKLQSRRRTVVSGDFLRRRNRILTYGSLMAGIVSAERPDEVRYVLQEVAAAKGSSQVKRRSLHTVGINAYFGGSVGHESVRVDSLNGSRGINSFSLFIPVGLQVSWRPGVKRETSFSLFMPIMDIGALTAYRIKDNDRELNALPQLSFRNVLAPGLHLMVNYGKTPFFTGIGLQYGPGFRQVNEDGTIAQVQAVRYMLTAGIDVPLLDFFKRE